MNAILNATVPSPAPSIEKAKPTAQGNMGPPPIRGRGNGPIAGQDRGRTVTPNGRIPAAANGQGSQVVLKSPPPTRFAQKTNGTNHAAMDAKRNAEKDWLENRSTFLKSKKHAPVKPKPFRDYSSFPALEAPEAPQVMLSIGACQPCRLAMFWLLRLLN